MATYYTSITAEQAALIQSAPLFFVASTDPNLAKGPGHTGPVNLSPKGGVRLFIVNPTRVAYLDYPGSGNETARHAVAGRAHYHTADRTRCGGMVHHPSFLA